MAEIRLLTKDEYPLAKPFYDKMEVYFPPNDIIIGAFEGNQLIGIRAFNFIPHTGSAYVIEEFRRQGIGHALMDFLCKNYNGPFYAFPSNEFAVKICQKAELKEVTGLRFFRREN